jgi:hypothetical protein
VSKYEWYEIPREFNWVARDKYGACWAFVSEPSLVGEAGTWVWTGAAPVEVGQIPDCISAETLPPWQESLEERPKPPPRYKTEQLQGGTFFTIIDTQTDKALTGPEILSLLNEGEKSD